MPDSLFKRVVVPVANREDARTTARSLAPHLESAGGRCVIVHVIEKAGGAPDKASVEQRELYADDLFRIVTDTFSTSGFDIETRTLYGKDVAATIIEAATDVDASAIVFTPRGGSRWVKVLAGDVTTALVNESTRPIIVLPDSQGDGG